MAIKFLTYDRGAVKRLRAAKGLTVLEVAFKAKLSQGTLYNIEGGATDPKASTLGRLAGALGVPVSAFYRNGEAA